MLDATASTTMVSIPIHKLSSFDWLNQIFSWGILNSFHIYSARSFKDNLMDPMSSLRRRSCIEDHWCNNCWVVFSCRWPKELSSLTMRHGTSSKRNPPHPRRHAWCKSMWNLIHRRNVTLLPRLQIPKFTFTLAPYLNQQSKSPSQDTCEQSTCD